MRNFLSLWKKAEERLALLQNGLSDITFVGESNINEYDELDKNLYGSMEKMVGKIREDF